MARVPLTPKEKEAIARAAIDGDVLQIAMQYDVSLSTVYVLRRKYTVIPPKDPDAPKPQHWTIVGDIVEIDGLDHAECECACGHRQTIAIDVHPQPECTTCQGRIRVRMSPSWHRRRANVQARTPKV